MGEKFDRWMAQDIPEEMYLSRNVRELARHHTEMTPDAYLKAMVTLLVGTVIELEERLVAVEKAAGIVPPPPRPIDQ